MNEKELIEKTIQILENMQNDLKTYGKCRFSDDTRKLISEVAEYCRKTKLYNDTKETEPDYIRTESAEYLYNHMIIKIAKAPLSSFGTASVMIMMPAIDDALKRGQIHDS